ncbi:hypothetical protein EVAR_42925_1 [Eumeta japonica]|uniref:Uncharacterized protein n=1 Tax=Eumeta variegata TaxID=151549 RepID=A0A4C1WXI5_EUMVA|nr:hypothetical protein EVAR_42925_1 [Eumeta japonica]
MEDRYHIQIRQSKKLKETEETDSKEEYESAIRLRESPYSPIEINSEGSDIENETQASTENLKKKNFFASEIREKKTVLCRDGRLLQNIIPLSIKFHYLERMREHGNSLFLIPNKDEETVYLADVVVPAHRLIDYLAVDALLIRVGNKYRHTALVLPQCWRYSCNDREVRMATQSARTASAFTKFKLLMWKNFLQQWRHKVRTAVEVALPVFTMTLVLILRWQIEPRQQNVFHYPPLTAGSLNYSFNIFSLCVEKKKSALSSEIARREPKEKACLPSLLFLLTRVQYDSATT